MAILVTNNVKTKLRLMPKYVQFLRCSFYERLVGLWCIITKCIITWKRHRKLIRACKLCNNNKLEHSFRIKFVSLDFHAKEIFQHHSIPPFALVIWRNFIKTSTQWYFLKLVSYCSMFIMLCFLLPKTKIVYVAFKHVVHTMNNLLHYYFRYLHLVT